MFRLDVLELRFPADPSVHPAGIVVRMHDTAWGATEQGALEVDGRVVAPVGVFSDESSAWCVESFGGGEQSVAAASTTSSSPTVEALAQSILAVASGWMPSFETARL